MNKFSNTKYLSDSLCKWYLSNKRNLPWRLNQDPYRIWISEVMLQQTTVQAVIPYFNRFIDRFPNVKTLSNAPIEEVLKYWSGLGYYSRARNIHKAAKQFAVDGFPQSYQKLLDYPGLGPYTARAVSSLAFNEPVGVLDGNVIRILTRFYGLKIEWWKTIEKIKLQLLSDSLTEFNSPSIVNQATMELGATICTPKSPTCTLCPWMKNCESFSKDLTQILPIAKPRRATEEWSWTPLVLIKKNKIALTRNIKLPFLKEQLLPPGIGRKLKSKPKKFDFKHNITHHNIYVELSKNENINTYENLEWIELDHLSEKNPSSLLKKILDAYKIN